MYLSKFTVKNFRSCYDTTVVFQGSLTLLVGENNSGKSNVIQALQLATTPLSGRMARFFEESDVSFGREGQTIELAAEFAEVTNAQKGQYLPALDFDTGTIHYQTRFAVDPRGSRFSRPTSHAGPVGGADPEPEQRDKIRHVYLAPLRDADRELNSADGRRLAQIIHYMFSESERKQFVQEANEHLKKVGDHDILKTITDKVQEHLTHITEPVRAQGIGIKSTDHDLRRLARSLRMKMAEHGLELADLADSGLGYANLLYIATVILELQSAKDVELTLFLVEEPEAHLHPQLQAVLLQYLKDQAEASKQDDTNAPAGRIQIICTTHSPNLASSVGIENVVVLRSDNSRRLPQTAEELAEEPGTPVVPSTPADRSNTVAIPIADLGLSAKEMGKISRYLDVTKAALLFGHRIVLVEGIAEALLAPTFTKSLYSADDAKHMRKRRDFSAVTVINVNGIDFKPYISLLLKPIDGRSILDKLVVITDGDPKLPELVKKSEKQTPSDSDDDGALPIETPSQVEEDDDELAEAEVVNNRKDDLEKFAAQIGVHDRLKVFESTYTFEADLLTDEKNRTVLKDAYLRQHPKSSRQWKEIVSAADPAREFYIRLRKNSKLISKGEFAYDIAAAIDTGSDFVCPPYFADAIREVLADGSEARGGS